MKLNILCAGIGILLICSCQKKETNPNIITLDANPTSATSCIASAQIKERGSYAITDHGFVCYYGSNGDMGYISNGNNISLGKEITKDTFSASFALTSNSYYSNSYKWYVRAYITNEKGTVYGNFISFDPLVLSLQNIVPISAKSGDTIAVNGNNFDPNPANNHVQFYDYSYFTAKVVYATKSLLKVIVPDFSGSYNYNNNYSIIVTIGSQQSSLNDVFTPAFSVTGFSPGNGTFNTAISISGSNFNQISGIMFGNTLITNYNNNGNYLTAYIPYNISTKKFKIYVLNGSTKLEVPGGEFVMNSLVATSFSPSTIMAGSSFTIYGSNFNANSSYNTVFIGSTPINNVNVYSNPFSVEIPESLTSGNYKVSVSNGLDTVIIPGTLSIVVTSITGISPTSGYWGTDLIITGHNFNIGYNYVYFNGSYYYEYFSDSTSFDMKVPAYLTPGVYKISFYNNSSQTRSPTDFTVLVPTLTSVTPASGTVGTSVVINGAGFGTDTGYVSVKFGSINATISAINNTQINAIVPSGVTSGSWMISVAVNGYTITNSLTFSAP